MAERSRLSQLPGTHFAQSYVLNEPAADLTHEQVVWTNNHNATVRLVSVGYIPEDTLTGANTNSMNVELRNKGADGTGATVVTTVKSFLSGTNANAFTADAQTLSSTVADTDIDANETVVWRRTKVGTGLTMPAGVVIIGYQFSQ